MENTHHLDVSRARARPYYRIYLENKEKLEKRIDSQHQDKHDLYALITIKTIAALQA
jgi:hypothetical protein